MAKMKLNPRRLALNSEFLPQYPNHVCRLANEELAPHPEENTCSRFALCACPNHQLFGSHWMPFEEVCAHQDLMSQARGTWDFGWYVLWTTGHPVLP